MAKGRKLTTSRSGLLLGYTYGQRHEPVTDESEFAEDDVWSTINGMVNVVDDGSTYNSHGVGIPRPPAEIHRNLTTRGRWPAVDGHVSGLSLAFNDSGKTLSPKILHQKRGQEFVESPRGRNMATSAPVNVPDWSKIYRVNSVESMHESDDGEDRVDMVPPHEYLARSRNSAVNSIYEGIGRTLKGRDMRRVRDAVWGQTGFNG